MFPKGTLKVLLSQPGEGASGSGGGQPGNRKDGRGNIEPKLENLQQIREKYPELATFAGNLQADYQRKTAEIADLRKKAYALDEIMRDPAVRSVLATGQAPSQQGNSGSDDDENTLTVNGRKIDLENADEDVKALAYLVRQQSKQLDSVIDSVEERKIDAMLDTLEKTYPDIKERMPVLMPKIRQGMTIKAAYLEEFGEDFFRNKARHEHEQSEQAEQREEEDREERQELPNIGGGGSEKASEQTKNIRSAISQAFEEVASK